MLDAAVLVPPGLRDLLLSVAHVGVFRPVWQEEIEDEVRRNGARLRVKRGVDGDVAAREVATTITQMNIAFPDARLDSHLWLPLVGTMTNDPKDRHVLAAAVGATATHVITFNMRDFPVPSRPAGVTVLRPEAFLLDCLEDDQERVLEPSSGWPLVTASRRIRSKSSPRSSKEADTWPASGHAWWRCSTRSRVPVPRECGRVKSERRPLLLT